jgi:hypothetical protein
MSCRKKKLKVSGRGKKEEVADVVVKLYNGLCKIVRREIMIVMCFIVNR